MRRSSARSSKVSERASAIGSFSTTLLAVRTASDGSFLVRVTAGEYAALTLSYRSHLGDTTAAATSSLAMTVPASLHLQVTPRTANVGETIKLEGTLAAATNGKVLVFEARAPGEAWIEFRGAKAGPHGSFTIKHKFNLRGPQLYHLRRSCRCG